jgi:hypothetical protein
MGANILDILKKIEELGAENLSKDAGQIAPKYLDPKITRPDQEVKPIVEGSAGQKLAIHKIKQVYPNYDKGDEFGISLISQDAKHPQAFAQAGEMDTKHHEGHHALVNRLVDKYGLPKIHNMYVNLVNKFDTRVKILVRHYLDQYPNYKMMTRHSDRRYRLARREEEINLLRDFVHQNDEFGHRAALLDKAKRLDFCRRYGFRNSHEMDAAIKSSWRAVRDHANSIKPEHLKDDKPILLAAIKKKYPKKGENK